MTSPRRELALAVVLCLVSAALLLVAAGRTWATLALPRAGLPSAGAAVTGRELAPVGVAAGILALAGAAALLAARRLGRLAVGVVLAVAGAAVLSFVRLDPAPAARRWAAARFGDSEQAPGVVTSAWPAVALVGGALLLAAGTLAAIRGRRWAAMSSRYERAPATAPSSGAGAVSAWDALDRGVDPTDESPARPVGPGQPPADALPADELSPDPQ